MSSELIVYKLDEKGAEVWQYPARVLHRAPRAVRLEAFFNRDRVDMGFVVFCRGDRFVETFYADRWYNVFAVYEGDSALLKGWYCNICRPATIMETAVRCEDLALDLWVPQAGEPLLLDEEEFVALDLSAAERELCWTAVAELRTLIAGSRLPR